MTRPRKPKIGGARPGAGRPGTTGRRAGRAVTLRLSAAEDAALTAAAGSPSAVGRYLRGAGLVLPLIVATLESAGDTLTEGEAVTVALGIAKGVR